MTDNEQQTITIINPKPQHKSPSLLGNMFILLALFGLIWGGGTAAKKWSAKPKLAAVPKEAESERHIVMEDLESEQPMAESAPVIMPIQKTEDRIPRTEDQKPVKKKRVKVAKKVKPKKEKISSVYAQPDPYTDGGPQELDRQENRDKYGLPTATKTTQKVKTVTATPPLPMDERDQFIPFEKD